MNTGQMPSVTSNLNVGAENKKEIFVDYQAMVSQSASKARGGRMDLGDGVVNEIKPSNKDQYQ